MHVWMMYVPRFEYTMVYEYVSYSYVSACVCAYDEPNTDLDLGDTTAGVAISFPGCLETSEGGQQQLGYVLPGPRKYKVLLRN